MGVNRGSSSLEQEANACFAMEAALSEPLFMGVPIGSTLGDFFILELMLKGGRRKINGTAIDWGRVIYHYFSPLSSPAKMPHLHSGRYLLTWLNEREHLTKLVLPLVGAFGPERCNIVCGSPGMRRRLPAEAGFTTFDQVYANAAIWRSAFNHVWLVWLRQIRAGARSYDGFRGSVARLFFLVLLQSQRVAAALQFLDSIKPAAVITEADRNTHGSCFVLAARARGIPAFTLIHGAINPPYGYTPVLADRIFCWGELHVRQLSALGVERERMIVTGCQALSRSLRADPGQARAKVGLPVEQPLVLLASSITTADGQLSLAEQFCTAFEKLQGVSAAIRLHPSERLDFYEGLRARFPSVLFLANDKLSADEALSAADVVVCHDSGFGNEALIKRKPVVIFDVLSESLRNGRTLVDEAICPRAASSDDLAAVVGRIVHKTAFREKLLKDADRFVNDFCAAFGDEAAANITAAVRLFVEDARV